MVGAQLHGLVDVLYGGGVGLDQGDGVVDHGDQQLVHHEAGGLLHLHGVLAQLNGQVVGELEHLGSGVDAPDDLHQLHAGHGVEEVHADDGVLQILAHLGDGQGGGVGGEDDAVFADGVQLLEQGALGLHVLLLDEDVGHQGVLGLLGHLALLHPLLQGGGQLILVALGRSGATGVHQGGVSLGREDLGNAAAHGAGTEDGYFHN